MPTYDYACSACGHRFEEFQSMSSDSLKKCPSCKKSKLERLIGTGAGVIFKGSGFYQTDYRGDAYKNDAKKDTEAGSKPSSDSKPSGGDKSSGGSKPSGSTSESASGSSAPKQD